MGRLAHRGTQSSHPPTVSRILAVDLAAKFSAVCDMTLGGTVLSQADTWGLDEHQAIDLITAEWTRPNPPLAMVVEDLPHRLPFAGLVRQVCRLQGRILERMNSLGALDAVLFAPPAEWRKTYPGLERGTGPDAVVPVAARLGYTPPDLTRRATKAGDKAKARKVQTDYCAAYLIARWAVTQYAQHRSFDIPGTTRYLRPAAGG